MDFSTRFRDDDVAFAIHQSRHHEVAMDYVVELQECLSVYKLVGHLVGYKVGLLLAVFGFAVYFSDFVFYFNAEDCLDQKD